MQPTAAIFEIQRFSIHDGPGIRSLVFFKGCNLHCPWCQNPESHSVTPVIGFQADRCAETFSCQKVCPNDAIQTTGFRVNHDLCNCCRLCIEACPHGALRLIGETLTPTDLMERIERDRAYYDSSGGGVTFSGGEATIHFEFLAEMLRLCSDAVIHTNLETAGTFLWEKWKATLSQLDLIYFDLKILDAELHQLHLGNGYSRIIHNATKLAELGFPVEFRVALVPGYTDTRANIASIIDFLHRVKRPAVHLLAYHNMGEAKLDLTDSSQPKLGLRTYSDEQWVELRRSFENGGIEILNL